jgi:hypothetical protein
MPGYGVVPANEGSGLLPWSWAEDKLRGSHEAQLGSEGVTATMTATGDGRDHEPYSTAGAPCSEF